MGDGEQYPGVERLSDGSVRWRRPNDSGGQFDWSMPEPPLLMAESGPGIDDAALSEAFRRGLLAELRPKGALQVLLADRIVLGFWRSLRGAAGGAARPRRMVVRWLERREDPASCYERMEFDSLICDAAVASMRPGDAARYDASISRQLRRDLEQLGAMQDRVIGMAPPARRVRPAEAGSRPKSKSRRRP